MDTVETLIPEGTPWEGLGTKIPSNATPDVMLRRAGLEWEVKKYPLYAQLDKRTRVEKSALVRESDKEILDLVSNNWKPLQNKEAFEMFHQLIKAGNMKMHAAGSLRGGQLVWAIAKLRDQFDLFGGDVIESYILLTNPHKFGLSIDIRFMPMRMVSQSTLPLAIDKHAQKILKMSHRREIDPNLGEHIQQISTEKMAEYKETVKFLGSKRITKAAVEEYFNKVFPVISTREKSKKDLSKSAERALEYMETQPGASFAKGTYWQAFNTVIYMIDHVLGDDRDIRLSSSWYGPNQKVKNTALEVALLMAAR